MNTYFPSPNSFLIPVLRARYILCHFKIFFRLCFSLLEHYPMDISFYACGLQKSKLKLAGLEQEEIIFSFANISLLLFVLEGVGKMDPLFIF